VSSLIENQTPDRRNAPPGTRGPTLHHSVWAAGDPDPPRRRHAWRTDWFRVVHGSDRPRARPSGRERGASLQPRSPGRSGLERPDPAIANPNTIGRLPPSLQPMIRDETSRPPLRVVTKFYFTSHGSYQSGSSSSSGNTPPNADFPPPRRSLETVVSRVVN